MTMRNSKLACDMKRDCAEPVTMLDQNGYAYCTAHGLQRRGSQPCRKLKSYEITKLESGGQLSRY